MVEREKSTKIWIMLVKQIKRLYLMVYIYIYTCIPAMFGKHGLFTIVLLTL
jgi:hypothetical protein